MKNVLAVLRQREMDLVRVREEVEALRCVIPLLTEEASPVRTITEETTPMRAKANVPETPSQYANKWPLEVRVIAP
jgi:hypothetical protein